MDNFVYGSFLASPCLTNPRTTSVESVKPVGGRFNQKGILALFISVFLFLFGSLVILFFVVLFYLSPSLPPSLRLSFSLSQFLSFSLSPFLSFSFSLLSSSLPLFLYVSLSRSYRKKTNAIFELELESCTSLATFVFNSCDVRAALKNCTSRLTFILRQRCACHEKTVRRSRKSCSSLGCKELLR